MWAGRSRRSDRHDREVDIDAGRLVEVVGEHGEGDVPDGLGDLLVGGASGPRGIDVVGGDGAAGVVDGGGETEQGGCSWGSFRDGQTRSNVCNQFFR